MITMPKTKFYAVRKGRTSGIYRTWADCKSQVDKFPGARYKSFHTNSEATKFLQGHDTKQSYSSSHNRTNNLHQHSYSTRYMSSYSDGPVPSRPVVYSDGCCFGNGRTNAKAGVGVFWGSDSSYNVSERLTGPQTNQRAELTAACRAVEGALVQGFSSVEVRTDSTYTIKALTEWMPKWRMNGWKTTNGEDVKNKTDLERLSDACSKIDVKWTHVPGHQGIPGNESADQLAKLGSSK